MMVGSKSADPNTNNKKEKDKAKAIAEAEKYNKKKENKEKDNDQQKYREMTGCKGCRGHGRGAAEATRKRKSTQVKDSFNIKH
jgi:hypothetical protein